MLPVEIFMSILYSSGSQTVRHDVLGRRFKIPRASHDNLVFSKYFSLFFRQKSFKRRFPGLCSSNTYNQSHFLLKCS